MLRYLIKRILLFIPALVIISLLAFIISANAPGDPIERMISAASNNQSEIGEQSTALLDQRKLWKHKLGLDLPLFYCSINSLADCDTIDQLPDPARQEIARRLIRKYGNWPQIQNYFQALDACKFKITSPTSLQVLDSTNHPQQKDSIDHQIEIKTEALATAWQSVKIRLLISSIRSNVIRHPSLNQIAASYSTLDSCFKQIELQSTIWKNYIPVLHFHRHNQYHRWIFGDGNSLTGDGAVFTKGIVRGDFGISYDSKEKIGSIILKRLPWSIFFSLVSILIAYLISIPLGIFSATHRGKKSEQIISILIFMLPALPTFWIATVLLMAFSNPDVLAWFPTSGVKPIGGYPEGSGFWQQALLSLPYIILPLICYTYGSIAFLSRTMRVGMVESLGQDYIRTARAKGLPEKLVIGRHALRNSLLPLITVFANVFPLTLGGSVIIENIFTIPGMGSTIFSALGSHDYPMIIAVFTLSGFLTMFGYLVSDILYALADPRIILEK